MVLSKGDGFGLMDRHDPHTQEEAAIPQIFHFKYFDYWFFESHDISAHDTEIIYMDIYKASPSWIFAEERVWIYCGRVAVDIERERFKLWVPAEGRLLKSIICWGIGLCL